MLPASLLVDGDTRLIITWNWADQALIGLQGNPNNSTVCLLRVWGEEERAGKMERQPSLHWWGECYRKGWMAQVLTESSFWSRTNIPGILVTGDSKDVCIHTLGGCMPHVWEYPWRPGKHWILWNWDYRQLCLAWHGCWEWNPGPLEEQWVLLITELSLSPSNKDLFLIYIWCPLWSGFVPRPLKSESQKSERMLGHHDGEDNTCFPRAWIICFHIICDLIISAHLSLPIVRAVYPKPANTEAQSWKNKQTSTNKTNTCSPSPGNPGEVKDFNVGRQNLSYSRERAKFTLCTWGAIPNAYSAIGNHPNSHSAHMEISQFTLGTWGDVPIHTLHIRTSGDTPKSHFERRDIFPIHTMHIESYPYFILCT